MKKDRGEKVRTVAKKTANVGKMQTIGAMLYKVCEKTNRRVRLEKAKKAAKCKKNGNVYCKNGKGVL